MISGTGTLSIFFLFLDCVFLCLLLMGQHLCASPHHPSPVLAPVRLLDFGHILCKRSSSRVWGRQISPFRKCGYRQTCSFWCPSKFIKVHKSTPKKYHTKEPYKSVAQSISKHLKEPVKCGCRQTCSFVVSLKVHTSTSNNLKVPQKSTSKNLKKVPQRTLEKCGCRQICSFVVSPAGRRLSHSLASCKTGSQEKTELGGLLVRSACQL